MKLRSILVGLLVLAQLGWLTASYITNSVTLATAPRILVKGVLRYYDGSGEVTRYRSITIDPNSPRIGKSIWWAADAFKTGNNELVQPRENPGDAVQGAMEIRQNNLWRDGKKVEDDEFSVIWSKQENGLWDFRLEARDSSEDVLGENEYRTKGGLRWSRTHTHKDTQQTEATINVDIFPSNAIYRINNDMSRAIRDWERRSGARNDVDVTMELAMRSSGQPKATRYFINGMPATDAIRLMEKDALPPAAEGNRSSKQPIDPWRVPCYTDGEPVMIKEAPATEEAPAPEKTPEPAATDPAPTPETTHESSSPAES